MLRSLCTMSKSAAAVIAAVAVLGGCASNEPTAATVTVTKSATVTSEPVETTAEPTAEETTPEPIETPEPAVFEPDEDAFVKAWLKQYPSLKPSLWRDGSLSIGWNLCELMRQQDEGIWTQEDLMAFADPNPKKAKAVLAAAEKYLCPR